VFESHRAHPAHFDIVFFREFVHGSLSRTHSLRELFSVNLFSSSLIQVSSEKSFDDVGFWEIMYFLHDEYRRCWMGQMMLCKKGV
jgi:hypothetical protein